MGWDISQLREYYNRDEKRWKTLESFRYVSRPTLVRGSGSVMWIDGIENEAVLPFYFDTRFYGLFAMLNHVRCDHMNVPKGEVFDPDFKGLPFDISPESKRYIMEFECSYYEDATSYATLQELRDFLETHRKFWMEFGYYRNKIGECEEIEAVEFFEEWLNGHDEYRRRMSEELSVEIGETYEIHPNEYRIVWTYNY